MEIVRDVVWHESGDSLSRACSDVLLIFSFRTEDNCYDVLRERIRIKSRRGRGRLAGFFFVHCMLDVSRIIAFGDF